jgi:hypothetical protein
MSHKEVINSFDQLALLNEVEKLVTVIKIADRNERVTRAIEEGLAIPYDRDKIKLASELESKKN